MVVCVAFWATSFVFDDVPSETYGLFLISEDGAGVIQNTGSNSVELYTQIVYRNPKPYLFGTQQTPVLTFDLCFASLTPVTAFDQQIIQKWLFGHNTYKKLQIMQCDMYDVYFNCILNNPTITTVGNYAYSFKCEVTYDAPWAWEYPKQEEYGPYVGAGNFLFNNISDDNYYMKPIWTISLSDNTESFQINNITDGSNCSFSGLLPNEIITIDSNRCIITSSTGLLRLGNMTGTLPRFLPGQNNIQIVGDVTSVVINYQNARKVSG